MKLDVAKLQYIIISDNLLGIENILTGDVRVMAEYYIPSDIMHITLLGEFRELGVVDIPPLSPERMSRLFEREIIAIYLELS